MSPCTRWDCFNFSSPNSRQHASPNLNNHVLNFSMCFSFFFFPLRVPNWQPKARLLKKYKVKPTKGNPCSLRRMPNVHVAYVATQDFPFWCFGVCFWFIPHASYPTGPSWSSHVSRSVPRWAAVFVVALLSQLSGEPKGTQSFFSATALNCLDPNGEAIEICEY